jgi:hypothetical protein
MSGTLPSPDDSTTVLLPLREVIPKQDQSTLDLLLHHAQTCRLKSLLRAHLVKQHQSSRLKEIIVVACAVCCMYLLNLIFDILRSSL